MHAAIRLFAVICLLLASGLSHAQLANGRYGSAQVFDVQRSPAFPVVGQPFTVSNFANPVQGGIPFRYTLAAGERVGFVEVSSDPCRYSLNIYDSGGGLVRTVHASGTIYGLGSLGFLHVSDPGDYGTFVANAAGYALGDSLSYMPSSGAATCAQTAIYAANTTPIDTVTPKYTVGGTISSLTAAGLVLRLNGTSTSLSISSGASSFTFPAIADGSGYWVEVQTQPSGQQCFVNNATGTVSGANVGNIQLDCRYTVSFTVSGVQADTFVTVFDGVNSLGGFRNGSHNTVKNNGETYAISVPTSPPGHVCAVTGPASGTISGAGVSGIAVTCDPIEYVIGGKTTPAVGGPAGISGLAPGNTVRLRLDYTAAVDPCASVSGALACKVSSNGSEEKDFTQNGDFSFTTQLNTGDGYAVTIASSGNPVTPYPQTCTPSLTLINKTSAASGTVGTQDVDRIAVDCAPLYYAVEGEVIGLAAGNSLVLQNNGGDDLEVTGDGSVRFATLLANGSNYAVTVLTQPTTPNQTCTLQNVAKGSLPGQGVISGSNRFFGRYVCTTNTYTVGGTVSGLLAGYGVGLSANGGTMQTFGNGPYAFTVTDGEGASISITQQPQGHTCQVVDRGDGKSPGRNITTLDVVCTPTAYTISGSISGLTQGNSLKLLLSYAPPVPCITSDDTGKACKVSQAGSEGPLTVSGTSFAFTTGLNIGDTYTVSIAEQPGAPAQACTLTAQTITAGKSVSGTIGTGNVNTLQVDCAPPANFSVGGSIIGLTGSGLVLQLNGGNDLAIAAGAGSFTFPSPLVDGSPYAVSVRTQPGNPVQTCSVSSGSGTLAGANVSNVAVTCSTSSFTVGGTVSGLAGAGLVLQLNGTGSLPVAANGSFVFPAIADGSTYAVSVLTQPSGPVQNCVVGSGSGTLAGANVGNVSVTCATSSFTVGGSVSGLAGSGLVLQLNGSGNLPVAANGSFVFPAIADGSTYAVSVLTQPSGPAQLCSVNAGSGTLAGANVSSVAVTCSTSSFTVGGSVSGLTGSGLVLQLNGGSTLPVAANGSFVFPAIADGSTYAVSVLTQPSGPAQLCSVNAGSGTLAGAIVSSVAVTCVNTVGPPGAPTNVRVVVSGSSATVSWTAPANDGGSPITGYTVVAQPGGFSCTVSGNPPPTSCQISGLQPNQAYTFTVTARNAAGAGGIGAGAGGTGSLAPEVIPVDQPWALALLGLLMLLLGRRGLPPMRQR